MGFHARVTVYPDVGVFQPMSFQDMIQKAVTCPGLDPAYTHILLDVTVTVDGSSAELTVLSEPESALVLDRSLRVVGLPPAYVRALDADGRELHAGPHPRPLQVGEQVAIGTDHYQVAAESWPGRDPDTGCCTGDIDWQHAVLTPAPQPPMHPVPA